MGNVERPNTVQIIPLGGLGEVGKNMTAIRYNHKMIVIDAGMTMPEDGMLGIDIVIPDIRFLKENQDQLMGIFLTHAHEDHIGALPYIVDELNVPIYGTKLTIGLLKRKFKERKLKYPPKLIEIEPRKEVLIPPYVIKPIRMNHSIPDAVALAVETPQGVIVHTGDFKIDLTPVDGKSTDFFTLAELGEKGVLALLSDSTNAIKTGHTKSEKIVGKNVERLFEKITGRIMIASFASNVHRLQQIFDAAEKNDRKVGVMGRSMVNMTEVAQQLGYLKISKGQLLDINRLLKLPDDQICIITTGSQGEPGSALSRIASKGHSQVVINKNDTVIFSAMAIPGNEKYVTKMRDHLLLMGAEVIYGKMMDIHVSGHGNSEDIKLIMSLLKPKFFLPIHGEYHMQIAGKGLALEMGIPESNIFVPSNGHVIAMNANKGGIVNRVYAGSVLVDGLGVGDVSNIVLRDRKILSENGIIIVAVGMDKSGKILAGPDIVSRGFVYVRQSEVLMEQIQEKTQDIINKLQNENVKDWQSIKSKLKEDLDSFVYVRTRRNPMIITVIVEV